MKRKLHYNTATTQMGGGHRDRPRGAKSVLYYIIKESYTTIINETYTTTLQQQMGGGHRHRLQGRALGLAAAPARHTF